MRVTGRKSVREVVIVIVETVAIVFLLLVLVVGLPLVWGVP